MRLSLQRFTRQVALGGLISIGLAPMVSGDILFSDFTSPVGLNLVGDAAVVDGVLRVCPALANRSGAAWFTTQQSLAGGFQTRFRFRIGEVGNGGADGFTFTIQGMSAEALGADGGLIGYSNGYVYPGQIVCALPNGITHSVAVEFDTWWNEDLDDPNANHISVHTRGDEANCASHDFSLGATTAIPTLSDDAVHEVEIRYVPGSLSIFLDDPLLPILVVPLDLATYPDLPVGWVGFTSATGSGRENHDILEWEFTEGADCSTTRYCTSTVNSSGLAATLYSTGSASLQQNDLVLFAQQCPQQSFGIFFYGRGATSYPLGDGFLCVSPFAPGLIRLMPVVETDGTGQCGRWVDYGTLPPAGWIQPGETWNFQFWFRDPAAGGTGSNLSDALSVTFCD